MKKPIVYKISIALTAILQAGLCVIVPSGVCILSAYFLVDKFSFPEYTKLIGVILGVLSGFYSMLKYLYTTFKSAYKDD